ncbi:MAG: hypothetical protein AAGI34_20320, partial [Pseudomonadota bacterium]
MAPREVLRRRTPGRLTRWPARLPVVEPTPKPAGAAVDILIQVAFSLLLQALAYVLTPRPSNEAPAAVSEGEFAGPTTEGRNQFVLGGTLLIKDPPQIGRGDYSQ